MIIFYYLLLINIAGALVVLSDKRRAIKKRLRISEKTILLLALSGGSFGVFLAMKTVRHKTQKPVFVVLIPVFIFFHTALLFMLYVIIPVFLKG